MAVATADAERQRVETAAARVLAEESNAASISATEALGASTVQVEALTLRVTDAETTEAELRAELAREPETGWLVGAAAAQAPKARGMQVACAAGRANHCRCYPAAILAGCGETGVAGR